MAEIVLTPKLWAKAKRELSLLDPALRKIIQSCPHEILKSRGNAFETLARSIVGQQISVKAADSIWKKFHAKVPSLKPEDVWLESADELRSCGLSQRKVEYLKDLARHFAEGLVKPHVWHAKTDAEIIAELTDIKGIGVWTAEMFLIFHLMRSNVFPAQDLGLQKAISLHYRIRYPMTKANLTKFRKKFHPWGSVAVWYMWRSLDPIPVEY